MLQIVVFILTLILSYMFIYMVSVRPELNRIDFYKKNERLNNKKDLSTKKKERLAKKRDKMANKKISTEINYILLRYKLDSNSIYYSQFLFVFCLVTAFDLAVAITIATLFERASYQILVGLGVLLVLALISYHFIGKYFQKKGMKKDV